MRSKKYSHNTITETSKSKDTLQKMSPFQKVALFIIILLLLTSVISNVRNQNENAIDINTINNEKAKLNENVVSSNTNILIINVGSKKTKNIKRKDIVNIMIVHFNDRTKLINVISMVNNTYVKIGNSNYYSSVINAYDHDNINKMFTTVRNATGISVKKYVVVNDETIINLVDNMGFITTTLGVDEVSPLNNNIVKLAKRYGIKKYSRPSYEGVHTLNGLQAAAYAETSTGKYGNIARDYRMRRIINKILIGLRHSNMKDIQRARKILLAKSDNNINNYDLIKLTAKIQVYLSGVRVKWPIEYHRHTYNGVQYVFPSTLVYNANLIHKKYLGETRYQPSSALKSQSRHIESVIEAIKKAKAEAKAKKAAEEAAKKAAEEKAKQETNNTDNNSSSNSSNTNNNSNNNSSNTNNNSNSNSNNNSSSNDDIIDNGGSSGDSGSGDSGFDIFN